MHRAEIAPAFKEVKLTEDGGAGGCTPRAFKDRASEKSGA
jgi:hypothetical protein